MCFFPVHEIPGRIRLRSASKFGIRMANELADRLDAIPGIEGVCVNPRTGSVLLLYANTAARNAACAILASPIIVPTTVQTQHPVVAKDSGLSLRPLLWYTFVRPLLPFSLRVITAVSAALPFLCKGISSLLRGKVNVDVLDASAIGISLLRRDLGTVSLLTLLLGFGEALEQWTRKKSLNSLAENLALNADSAWVRRGGVEVCIPLQDLQENDIVVVRAGNAIPVDGVVVEGEALINQASMTGEPLGVLRSAGAAAFAGTVVEEGTLVIRATGVGDGTRLRKIIHFIEKSESLKAGVQGKAERLADAVVPFSFMLAGAVWLLTRNPARAAAVLLVDYSCALRLATPLAILAAMRESIGHGILVKGGAFLEALSAVDTVVFDKTGTLTESRPKVVDVVPAPGFMRDNVLRLAACLEEHFPHPVARAVVHKAEEENLHHLEEHTEVEYVMAHGIASRLKGKRVLIGSRHYVQHDEQVNVESMSSTINMLSQKGRSLLYLAINGRLVGIIGIEDPLREESTRVVAQLRARGMRVIMLTGDDERTASAVAAYLGIDEYRAQVLPVDKASVIQKLRAEGRTVLMVGDGINDSPALSTANVGVTLRDGADLAREVADVVLMDCDLYQLAVALQLGRGTMRRIHTNFGITITLNTLFLAAGLTGILQPGASAVLHNLTTMGVALNAMRPVLDSCPAAKNSCRTLPSTQGETS